MAVNDTLNGCQPDSGARKLGCFVQTLKSLKQLGRKSHIKANSVVANEEWPGVMVFSLAEFNPRLVAGAGELDGVPEEVRQCNLQKLRVAHRHQSGLDQEFQ